MCLHAGKPVLSFLNLLLYLEAYKGFTDITSGQSICCNGSDTQTEAPVLGGRRYSGELLECDGWVGSGDGIWGAELWEVAEDCDGRQVVVE